MKAFSPPGVNCLCSIHLFQNSIQQTSVHLFKSRLLLWVGEPLPALSYSIPVVRHIDIIGRIQTVSVLRSFFYQAVFHQSNLRYTYSPPVSSDTIIAIAFGLISTLISIVSLFVAYLTLREMKVEACMFSVLCSAHPLSISTGQFLFYSNT
jgi:hypothetical protein